jgi:hypothetical protein
MKYILYIILCFSAISISAQQLDFSQDCRKAYQLIFKFKFGEGNAVLNKIKTQDANNKMPYFIENYIDFFSLYISEDKNLYAKVKKNTDNRLNILKNCNKNSPYYLYTQAEIYLQWALCKLKFQEYFGAVLDIRKAFNLLNENQKKYPDFKPNLKSLGFLHTVFGAVPDNYKLGAKILGLKGSIEQGLAELNEVINLKDFEFRDEALILYTFLQLHLNKNGEKAWKLIENQYMPPEDNLLFVFAKANVAQYLGKNDEVIQIIRQKPTSDAFYPIHYLDFMLGNALLQKLDKNAVFWLNNYIEKYKGNSYIKEAYRKLAWYYLINNQPNKYKEMMLLCKNFPVALTDEDKSAHREAERGILPDKTILEARILFDGNYLNAALEKINKIDEKKLNGRNLIEYYYRKARILDEAGEKSEANNNYILVISKSKEVNYYFAANACLKLAQYFEQQKKKLPALQYYNKALDLPKDEYENSINAEAKAGINRLE